MRTPRFIFSFVRRQLIAVLFVALASLVGDTALSLATVHSATINGKSLTIYNYSDCSDSNVDSLATAADNGAGNIIDAGDRLFARSDYLVWIDNTGFFGKLNGIWRLTKSPVCGVNVCDFASKLPDNRAPNNLIPGEDGNGFTGTIPKGVHFEIFDPNTANVYFSTNDWVRNNGWCSPTQGRFEDNPPVLDDVNGGFHTFQWVAPLTHEAGNGQCHARDFLDDNDSNGIRASLDLIVTYHFHEDGLRIAEGVALRNNGPEAVTLSQFGLVYGFVVAKVSNTVPWKNYVYSLYDPFGGTDSQGHSFSSGVWSFHDYNFSTNDYSFTDPGYDNVVGASWTDGPSNMSFLRYSAGSADEANTGWTEDSYYRVYLSEGGAFAFQVLQPGETTATVYHLISIGP